MGGFRDAAYPSDFVRIGRKIYSSILHIYYEGTTTAIPLGRSEVGGGEAANASTAGIDHWELRNHTGLVTHTGGSIAAGGSWAWPTPALECGWYRLYFYRSDDTLQGGGSFVVTRNVTGMPTIAPIEGHGYELYLKTAIGWREFIRDEADSLNAFWAAEIDETVSLYEDHWDGLDAARPNPRFMACPEFSHDTPGHVAGITAAADRWGVDFDYWEGLNEPGGNNGPGAWYVEYQEEFYNAVKAGEATAQVMGPSTLGIGGKQLPQLEAFFAGGGGDFIDAVSFHTYNSHMGSLPLGRRSWDNFVTLLTAHGQHNKVRINTEAASFFAAEHGHGSYLRQAQQTMLDLFLNEQYGVAKERWCLFYAISHGFWSYPSYYAGTSGTPMPAVGMLMTHSQELIGCDPVIEARHDFGTVDNDFVIGSTHRRADGTGVLAVMACGKPDHPLTLEITGGAPATLVTVDCWGNEGTVNVSGGLVSTTIGQWPTYFRLPANVTATPTDDSARYGTNRTTGATATCSAGSRGTTVIASVLDGSFPNNLYNDISNDATANADSVWQASDDWEDGETHTFTVVLDGSTTGNKLLIQCPAPWGYYLSVILAGTVETRTGGVWTQRATFSQDPTVIPALTWPTDGVNGYVDSYWNDQCIYEVDFDRVTCDAVRINATQISYGGNPYQEVCTGYGLTDWCGFGNPDATRMSLAKVTLFDAPDDEGEPGSFVKYLVRA